MTEFRIEKSFADQAWSMKNGISDLENQIEMLASEGLRLLRSGCHIQAKANLSAAAELCSSIPREQQIILEHVLKHLDPNSSYLFFI